MSTATKKNPAKRKRVAKAPKPAAPAAESKPAPKVEPHTFTHTGGEVLILRRCNPDGTSHNGFRWPESGEVEAPDWRDDNECGGGLHGWPWGLTIGDGSDFSVIEDKWIVFAAAPEDVRAIGGKCKARKGRVVYCGDFATAWAQINDGRDALIRAMALTLLAEWEQYPLLAEWEPFPGVQPKGGHSGRTGERW